jgi:hypothetical protein
VVGWAQAALSVWLSLGAGASQHAPLGWAPARVELRLSKAADRALTWDGAMDVAWSKRAWSAAPASCEVGMSMSAAAEASLAREGKVSEKAMELFLLAHELGHCADRRAPVADWRAPEEDARREAFADAFAACAMRQQGEGQAARLVAGGRLREPKSRQAQWQKRSTQWALSSPHCESGGGFLEAQAFAVQAEAELFGGLAPQLP